MFFTVWELPLDMSFSTFCQLSESVISSHYVQGWDYKFFIVHHQPENAALPTSASSSQVKELIPSIQFMFSPQGFDKHSFISRTDKKKSMLQTIHYTENGQTTTQFSPILVGNRKVGVKMHTPAVLALLHYTQLALCARLAIASRWSNNRLGLVYQSPRARLPIASRSSTNRLALVYQSPRTRLLDRNLRRRPREIKPLHQKFARVRTNFAWEVTKINVSSGQDVTLHNNGYWAPDW